MLDELGLGRCRDPLFGGDGLPFDGGVVIRAATGGAQPVHRSLDVIIAELAYLADASVRQVEMVWLAGSWQRASERTW